MLRNDYESQSCSIAGALEAVGGIPQTVYFTRRGTQVYDHAGPYESAAALEHDIRFYVLR